MTVIYYGPAGGLWNSRRMVEQGRARDRGAAQHRWSRLGGIRARVEHNGSEPGLHRARVGDEWKRGQCNSAA